MIREFITSTLQSKNTVMFVTSIIFMAGILSYFNNCEIIIATILSICGIIAIIYRKISIRYIIFWLFIFYFGFFNAYLRINTTDTLNSVAPTDATIRGQIVSIPDTSNDKTKFFLKVNSLNGNQIDAKTLVTINKKSNKFVIGEMLEINGKIRKPFKAGNPSQFDYGNYLKNFDTFTTTYAELAECKPINSKLSHYWNMVQKLSKIRNSILATHSKYLKSPNLEILGGIVFGDDAITPPNEIKLTFINSGLLHILAASGMNVAFIFGFWFCIMRFFHIPYRINIIGGLFMVILYTLMTGLSASVLRAALMLIFIQIGKLIDRDAHSVSLLSFVAFLLLIYNPAYINDVGFQLSFVVTFGLLTTAQAIFDKMKEIKLADWIKAGILIPIIAQIWVAPIQMFYFNTLSTYSIIANILTVPFLSIISFGGFISSILATIKPIADLICMSFDYILKIMLDYVVAISNSFANLPHSLIETTHPNILQVFVYYTIILLITLIIKFGLNKKILISIATLTILLLTSTINIPNHKLEVITFDVGNADAFLIKTPQNKFFIIDTAKLAYKSSSSTAKMVILKYLKDRGIKNIEGLIITHFDLDHAGGAADLIENLNVKNVYINSLNADNYTIKNLFNSFDKAHLTPTLVKNSSQIYSENNLKINTTVANIKDNDNENSIITLLSYKDFDMLFTGDAGIIAFEKLKEQLPNDIEVLKVGHHGGRNVVNKEMINYLNNNVSIISTGPNAFGHPNRSTLEILRDTHIYRTDKHNSIKIKTDGENYEIATFDRLKKKYIKSMLLKSY